MQQQQRQGANNATTHRILGEKVVDVYGMASPGSLMCSPNANGISGAKSAARAIKKQQFNANSSNDSGLVMMSSSQPVESLYSKSKSLVK